VNCFQCKHFVVTWDKHHPYGCRAWNIRSPQHPSIVVHSSSGMQCQLFQPKDPGKKGNTPRPGKQ